MILRRTRRLDGTHLEGRWDFPGGKCAPGGSLRQCLGREMHEERGVDVDIGEEVLQVEHAYPERAVRLHFFACHLIGDPHARARPGAAGGPWSIVTWCWRRSRPWSAAWLASARRRSAPGSTRDRQDIIVLNLQRAVQAMLDLAAHVVAREGLGVPDELAASFELLKRAGILDDDLAGRMRRMTGFRNVAVHEYRKLDPKIVDAIVQSRLGDLCDFARTILERFRI